MDWDWVKRIGPTVAVIGTVVGMFFLFDGWQKERFLWIADDIARLDAKIDKVEERVADDIRKVEERVADDIRKVEERVADDIRKVEERLAGDIQAVLKRLDSLAMAPDASASPASTTIVRLLAGEKIMLPISSIAIRAGELPTPEARNRLLPARYAGSTLTLYPDADDRNSIALLLEEGWSPIDPANIAGGFILPQPPNDN